MADDRFFRRGGPFSLGEIAQRVDASAPSSADSLIMIQDVASLDCAVRGDITLFSDGKYAPAFAANHASVVVTSTALSHHAHNGSALLIVKDPKFAFAQIGHMFYAPENLFAEIDATAQIHPRAEIGKDCQIGPGVVIGAHAKIGANCRIGANTVIGEGSTIGDNCRIGPNTSISHAIIGSRVHISSNASIGGQGFGFVLGASGVVRVPQLGRVIIGDDVQMGSNCTIDRGAMDDTLIGAGTMMDNMVHIAHNVRIGSYCIIAGQCGIAGSATLGDQVLLGGQVGVNDHIKIGSYARIAAKSGIIVDVPERAVVGGYPAVPIRQWHRQTLKIAQIAKRRSKHN